METFYKKAKWLIEAQASESLLVKSLLEAREEIFKAGLSTVSVQRAIKDILKQEADHKKGLSHF